MTVDYPCKSSTVKVHQNFSVISWNMLGNIVKRTVKWEVLERINYVWRLNGGSGQRWRWREGDKHTSIADTTQILNNLEYISKTANINSQNKKHFTDTVYKTSPSHTRAPCKLLRPRWETMVHRESYQTFYKASFDLSFLKLFISIKSLVTLIL